MSQKSKVRLALACPCCGREVTHRRYGFNVLRAPAPIETWYVCDACEIDLTGPDTAAHDKAVRAFSAWLESGVSHAPTP
jgi:hypothetical protein